MVLSSTLNHRLTVSSVWVPRLMSCELGTGSTSSTPSKTSAWPARPAAPETGQLAAAPQASARTSLEPAALGKLVAPGLTSKPTVTATCSDWYSERMSAALIE